MASVKLPKPHGSRSSFRRSRTSARSKSSISGGTTTIGAPLNIEARAWAKPEYCVPAMGWQPTKVKGRPSAIFSHRSQMTRLTPTVSITMAPAEMSGAISSSHETAAAG